MKVRIRAGKLLKMWKICLSNTKLFSSLFFFFCTFLLQIGGAGAGNRRARE